MDFFLFYVRYTALLHLLLLSFHCVGGYWYRIQNSVDYGSTALAVRRSNHSARSHPPYALIESDENMRECILLSSLTLRSSSVAVKKSSLSSRGCSDTLQHGHQSINVVFTGLFRSAWCRNFVGYGSGQKQSVGQYQLRPGTN